jgi:hypothetical protein
VFATEIKVALDFARSVQQIERTLAQSTFGHVSDHHTPFLAWAHRQVGHWQTA